MRRKFGKEEGKGDCTKEKKAIVVGGKRVLSRIAATLDIRNVLFSD